MKNIVDSSGWIEYFTDGSGADNFSGPIEDTKNLLVPAVSITEVFRFVLREVSERHALQVAALMRQATEIPLTYNLALSAGTLGHTHKLPLSDSIIYAVALAFKATVWTQDADFAELQDVNYFPKSRG